MTHLQTSLTPAIQGCTQLKLSRVSRLVSRHHEAYVSASGLKMSQYSLLSSVMTLEPVRAVDLARALNLDASTLTRTLKPMMLAGLLEVRSGPDARSSLIAITTAGRKKRAEAHRLWQVAQAALQQKVGAEQLAALHCALARTLDKLADAAAPETNIATA